MDFEKWLHQNTKLKASTIRVYVSSFLHLADLILESSGRDSLRSSCKASVLLFIDDLFENNDYLELNKRNHGRFTASLKYFKKYL